MNKIKQVGNIVNTGNFKNPQRGRIYSINGISPSLNTVGGGGLEPKVIIKEKIVCEERKDEGLRTFKDGVLGTIRTINSGGDKRVIEKQINSNYRIRKLTPKECWRLMGFSDEDFEKVQNTGMSNTQLYKQAGNSIVVNVLYYIFKNLYTAMPYLFEDLKVGSYFSGIGAVEVALNKLFNDINFESENLQYNEYTNKM